MPEERMWAPWRLDYIRGEKRDRCIFCAAVESDDDRAHLVVERGDTCFVMLNAYPYTSGHVMVSPYVHVPSIEDLPEEALGELMALTRRSLEAIGDAYRPEGFNVGINQGKVAGAGFDDHVHQHVVPRWGGDTNFMSAVGGTRVLPQSLDESWEELAGRFG